MKLSLKKIFAAIASSTILLSAFTMTVSAATPDLISAKPTTNEYMNVGYAFRRGLVIEELDLSKITHLNYSFGLIYNREEPPDPTAELNPDCMTPTVFDENLLNTIYLPDDAKSDLKKLPALKAVKNPDLKVMLSVGGYNARGFSDAAATDAGRKAFAQSCKDVIEEYDLAGIDLDWEYPTIDWANIKIRPGDPKNYTLLLKEVRAAIGPDKLLSMAGSANVNFPTEWIEFKEVMSILDFINIMTYDFQYGTCYYGYALYGSTMWPTKNPVDEYNVDVGVQNYLKNGCPPEKINVGLHYSGITLPSALRDEADWAIVQQNLKDCGYKASKEQTLTKISKFLENKYYICADGRKFRFEKKWDDKAKMSYICTYNNEGKELFVMSYSDSLGLTAKLDYVKANKLGGTMFWQFGSDPGNLLTSQTAKELNINGNGTK